MIEWNEPEQFKLLWLLFESIFVNLANKICLKSQHEAHHHLESEPIGYPNEGTSLMRHVSRLK
jgi:hypothetical protein